MSFLNLVAGAFLGVLFTAIFSEYLGFWMTGLFNFAAEGKRWIIGDWDVYLEPSKKELVEIRQYPGNVTGNIKFGFYGGPEILNHRKLRRIIHGKMIGDYFIGTWFDPYESGKNGVFQLRLDKEEMVGKRLYLDNNNIICEDWNWSKHVYQEIQAGATSSTN